MDNLKARGRGRCTRSVHDIIAVPQKAVVLHQTMWPYPVCARHTPSLRGINNTTNYTHTASGVVGSEQMLKRPATRKGKGAPNRRMDERAQRGAPFSVFCTVQQPWRRRKAD
jgi:hypothetical protein